RRPRSAATSKSTCGRWAAPRARLGRRSTSSRRPRPSRPELRGRSPGRMPNEALYLVVNIDVPDLEPAIQFYEAAVGAKLQRLLDDNVAELAYGATLLYLLRKPVG